MTNGKCEFKAVKRNGKYGYVNELGNLVIPCSWDDAHDFSEGLGAVEKDGKWGYIDETGTLVIPNQWFYAMPFSEEVAAVSVYDQEFVHRYGYIDKSGRLVIPYSWHRTHKFSEGLAWVAIKDTFSPGKNGFADQVLLEYKYGYIDHSGTLVIPCEWDDANDFKKGLALVRKKTFWSTKNYYINKTGEVVR